MQKIHSQSLPNINILKASTKKKFNIQSKTSTTASTNRNKTQAKIVPFNSQIDKAHILELNSTLTQTELNKNIDSTEIERNNSQLEINEGHFLLKGELKLNLWEAFSFGFIGAGIGGFVGCIAGFLIGGPIGCVVGAIIGAIAGGYFGKEKASYNLYTVS